MQNGRKIAAIVGDPTKHQTELLEIGTSLTARGFLVYMPFPQPPTSVLMSSFEQFEYHDILEAACHLADLIVIANISGLDDDMEYMLHLHGGKKDIVYVNPPDEKDEKTEND